MKRLNFGNATGRDLYLDVPLSNVAMNHMPQDFIGEMIFPVVPTPKQSGSLIEFSRADSLRRDRTTRAPGTEANRVYRTVSSHTYYCNNYALMDGVTVEDRENADPIYVQGLFNNRAKYLSAKLRLDAEIRIANQVTSGSNVGSHSTVTSAWNLDGGNPLVDIWTAVDNVQGSTGKRPNRIVFGDQAWRSFRRNANVRNLIFGTNNGGGYPNVTQAQELLEMEWIGVGREYRNTADEGITESLASIWKDFVLVYYAPMNPSQEEPSLGYTLRWTRPGIPDMAIERHPYDTRRKIEDIEIGVYQDEKITGTAYGYLLRAVNSSQ